MIEAELPAGVNAEQMMEIEGAGGELRVRFCVGQNTKVRPPIFFDPRLR
jgi:hypothetical protein